MSIYILIIIILTIIILSQKINSARVIYLKSFILPLFCITFILLLITFSHTAAGAASKGIQLWLNIVFPSLFPFFVASQLLNKTGMIKAIGILLEPIMRPLFNVPGCSSFALAMGVTSGYPVGAKITTDMREQELLTKTEAERLLTFTNNSGPLFIIGAVSVGMFKIPRLGIFLLLCHICATMTVGILFRFYGKKSGQKQKYGRLLSRFKKEAFESQKDKKPNLGSAFGDAIRDSVFMMLSIGGYIIFFSVIINLLLETRMIYHLSIIATALLSPLGIQQDLISAVISGFFEITTGVNMVCKSSAASLIQQLTAASVIIGWAGLSVHSQVLSIISKTDISIKPYLFGKLLHGIISGIYTYLFLRLNPSFLLQVKSVFAQMTSNHTMQWYNYLLSSFGLLLTTLFLVFAVIFMTKPVKQFSKQRKQQFFHKT